jgi:hypothetical protein
MVVAAEAEGLSEDAEAVEEAVDVEVVGTSAGLSLGWGASAFWPQAARSSVAASRSEAKMDLEVKLVLVFMDGGFLEKDFFCRTLSGFWRF